MQLTELKNQRWIGFVAGRLISQGRKNRSSPSAIFAILGIFTGVLALTVILAVMNGFQLGFIESILEISSYHIRVENVDETEAAALAEKIMALPQAVSAVPFRETQGIIRSARGSSQAAFIRALDNSAIENDRGMADKLEFESGSFDLGAGNNILLGSELARRLSARVGDRVTLISAVLLLDAETAYAEQEEGSAGTFDGTFEVAGIFRSGFYEYDLSWVFINLDAASYLNGGEKTLKLGVKLKDRWQDRTVLEAIKKLIPNSVSCSSWRDYNRAFFGALRTEKLFMFILVGLIFIVVALNIYQGQRRSVLEHREDIGLLRAVGASDWAVRSIFVWDGFVIGLTGAGLGMILGLVISFNIRPFFTLLETIVNGIIHLLNAFAGLLGLGASAEFAIFSPAIFYIREIPARIIPQEVIIIFLFGFLSAIAAAWFASARVSRMRPAEVLRDE
ncbi:hypothetical protein FACS1894151_01490 [Spirochaetia bacterium]|nr:hypothetical protein FACS1894151_01490 [Spirochaetia bacterium]